MIEAKNYTDFIKKTELTLKDKLFDQDLAVESLTKTLLESHLLHTKSKIQALFTFIGPANSGKHYLCELLAQLEPHTKQLKTFYMDQYSGNFGIGAEQLGAVSFQSDVIEFIEQNQNIILVFEDIDKADLQVQLALYTLFTDYEKTQIDFSNIIVIITTTCLSSLLQRKDIKKVIKNDPLQAHTFLIEQLSHEQVLVGDSKENTFDKKLLSLLNEHTTIIFNNLSIKTLIKIGARSLHQMSQAFIKKSDIVIEYNSIDIFVSLITLSLAPFLNVIVMGIPDCTMAVSKSHTPIPAAIIGIIQISENRLCFTITTSGNSSSFIFFSFLSFIFPPQTVPKLNAGQNMMSQTALKQQLTQTPDSLSRV